MSGVERNNDVNAEHLRAQGEAWRGQMTELSKQMEEVKAAAAEQAQEDETSSANSSWMPIRSAATA